MTRIETIDLHYLGTPEAIASYILIGNSGPVMIETGPGSTTEALAAGLANLGFEPGDVQHVLVTHIHFDHAGASGWMAKHGAQIYVHEFGAKHLIDPARLVASAKRIYRDRMDELWGELIPIPESQVTPVHDNDVIEADGLMIRAIETPGHAKHHHAFSLDTEQGRVYFTGDAAATYIEGCDQFISVPTPPPEFDLETWLASVERLETERFDVLYPTHFGPVHHVADHLARVKPTLREHAKFVRMLMDGDFDRTEMLKQYREWFIAKARADDVPPGKMGFYVTDTLADMNLTGIQRYWTKLAEQATA
jgi:glyoxylase-like metal-dependent hydrolase (beta-lactamase superfamily II)